MTRLERTILIDKYLSGEMSAEEKSGFEKLLSEAKSSSTDETSLREDMELQQEIENAIRERGLREMLRKEEKRIRHRQKITKVTIWSLGSGSVISVIAAVILFLIVISPLAHQMQDYSSQYVAQVEVGNLRGDNEIANKLSNALLLMQNKEWEKASAIVNEVLEQTSGSQEEQMLDMYNNAEWLNAICLMHNGKVFKAKRLLRKIANSESHYSTQAAELLETL